MEIKCPVCESANVTDSLERSDRSVDLGFGVSCSVETWDQICHECGFQGSFDGKMDQKFEAAWLKAHERLRQILSDRLRAVASDSAIERALALQPYTLRRWREKADMSEQTYITTALMRVLAKYPHVLGSELALLRKKTEARKNAENHDD